MKDFVIFLTMYITIIFIVVGGFYIIFYFVEPKEENFGFRAPTLQEKLERSDKEQREKIDEIRNDIKFLTDYLGVEKWSGLDKDCVNEWISDIGKENVELSYLKIVCDKTIYTKDPDKKRYIELWCKNHTEKFCQNPNDVVDFYRDEFKKTCLECKKLKSKLGL